MDKPTQDIEGSNVISIQRETAECRDPVFDFMRRMNGIDYRINFNEADKRLTLISEIDISQIQFVSMTFEDDDVFTGGETLLSRLKVSGHIRLDAYVLLSMMKNQLRIPKKWHVKCDVRIASRVILFGGTILEDDRYRRCVLGLRSRDGRLEVGVHLLECKWADNQALFAVLPFPK